ncbi:angiogenin-like [Rhinatrema bivittatum]|uniref:angiogenin-like n=1 Tax=Rhinatrema bivittatum TaxID=194408 RepID=UPI0011293FD2|nr:angiogenin-like [Rhinatrema bivittatum]
MRVASILLFLFLHVSLIHLSLLSPSPSMNASLAFERKHLDTKAESDDRYCNEQMRKRGMTSPNCTLMNLFIRTHIKEINRVCRHLGNIYGNDLKVSQHQYLVTECRYLRGQPPECLQILGYQQLEIPHHHLRPGG